MFILLKLQKGLGHPPCLGGGANPCGTRCSLVQIYVYVRNLARIRSHAEEDFS